MSPDLFIAKMDIERFGGTAFPKTTDMSGGWNLSLPFKSPTIWGIWSFNKIVVLSACFDPYWYVPSFGCHACTRKVCMRQRCRGHGSLWGDHGPTEYIARITSLEQNPEKGSSLPAHNLITSVFCSDESDQSEDQTGSVLAGILLSLLLQRGTTGSRSGWLRLELVVSQVRHRAPRDFIVNKNDLHSHYLVFEESHRFRQGFLLCERSVVGVCLHHLDVSICTSCMRVC